MRKSFQPAILAAVVAVAAAGTAFADDNGMTPGYGDSWADLQAHNPAAAATPPYSYQQNGVVIRRSTVARPPSAVVMTPAPRDMTSPSVAAPQLDPSAAGTMPAPETELNTGHYIDSNGNPVVPPANARPAR